MGSDSAIMREEIKSDKSVWLEILCGDRTCALTNGRTLWYRTHPTRATPLVHTASIGSLLTLCVCTVPDWTPPPHVLLVIGSVRWAGLLGLYRHRRRRQSPSVHSGDRRSRGLAPAWGR